MKPYTYLIKHNPTNTYYYGVRYQNVKKKIPIVEDLWTKYFTSSPTIKKLISKYGVDSFSYEIRKIFNTSEQALAWETKVLRRCNVLHSDKWINANIAGNIMPTIESNKKISDFHKGKPKSEEHKRKIGIANKGKKKPPVSDETRKKLSEAGSGKNNVMYGKKHSAETRKKMSEALKGKVAHNKGKPMSTEQKQKLSDAMRGRKVDPEVIKRRVEKQRGQKREKKHCPHCNKHIAVGWYNRHGDNCKLKV